MTNHDYFSVLHLDATLVRYFFWGIYKRGPPGCVKKEKMFAMEYILDMMWAPMNGGWGKVCHLNLCIGIGHILPTIGGYMSIGGVRAPFGRRVGKCAFSRISRMYFVTYNVRYVYSHICTYIRGYQYPRICILGSMCLKHQWRNKTFIAILEQVYLSLSWPCYCWHPPICAKISIPTSGMF